jgi:hypothetical protein
MISTVAGSGTSGYNGDNIAATSAQLYNPSGVAVDSVGNLYIADYHNIRIRKVSATAVPLSFPATNPGSNSAAQTVTASNIGNAPLTLASTATTTANFAVSSSSPCLTAPSLAVGSSCAVDVYFAPTVIGSFSDNLVFTDNALNIEGATQSVSLSGAVQASPQSQTITFTNPGAQTYGVAPFALTATASSGLTVTYTVTSGPATASGSTLTITDAGSVTVEANQAGNGAYAAAAPVQVTFMVQDFSLPATPPAVNVAAGQSKTIAFTVTPRYGFTGTISFACAPPANMSEASCSVSSVQITGASGADSTLIVTTTGAHQIAANRHRNGWYAAEISLVLAAFAWGGVPVWKRRRNAVFIVMLIVLLIGGAVSCGGQHTGTVTGHTDTGTPAGIYALTVTATSGSASHIMSVPVTVQ